MLNIISEKFDFVTKIKQYVVIDIYQDKSGSLS